MPSVSTIWRVLKARGFVTPEPHKRPKSAHKRFSAELPNECWQADVTHVALGNGRLVEVSNVIDDHSRLCVAWALEDTNLQRQPCEEDPGPSVDPVICWAEQAFHLSTFGTVCRCFSTSWGRRRTKFAPPPSLDTVASRRRRSASAIWVMINLCAPARMTPRVRLRI